MIHIQKDNKLSVLSDGTHIITEDFDQRQKTSNTERCDRTL